MSQVTQAVQGRVYLDGGAQQHSSVAAPFAHTHHGHVEKSHSRHPLSGQRQVFESSLPGSGLTTWLQSVIACGPGREQIRECGRPGRTRDAWFGQCVSLTMPSLIVNSASARPTGHIPQTPGGPRPCFLPAPPMQVPTDWPLDVDCRVPAMPDPVGLLQPCKRGEGCSARDRPQTRF